MQATSPPVSPVTAVTSVPPITAVTAITSPVAANLSHQSRRVSTSTVTAMAGHAKVTRAVWLDVGRQQLDVYGVLTTDYLSDRGAAQLDRAILGVVARFLYRRG